MVHINCSGNLIIGHFSHEWHIKSISFDYVNVVKTAKNGKPSTDNLQQSYKKITQESWVLRIEREKLNELFSFSIFLSRSCTGVDIKLVWSHLGEKIFTKKNVLFSWLSWENCSDWMLRVPLDRVVSLWHVSSLWGKLSTENITDHFELIKGAKCI